jgi:threonyl-tRNA synthetase
MGSDQVWDQAEGALELALKAMGMPFTVNPGDGAFYGPKLDIMFVDSLGRPWQLGTLQVDFNLPQAFDLSFVDKDNQQKRPVMLHRAILGSFERFIGVYLEHTAGDFPFWLSPTQILILNVTDRVIPYCQSLMTVLKKNGLRVEWDARPEKLNYKIREAELRKVPMMVIIGDKEMQENSISIRIRKSGMVSGVSLDGFVSTCQALNESRSLQISPALFSGAQS